MVRPIIRGKSYVGETFKSINASQSRQRSGRAVAPRVPRSGCICRGTFLLAEEVAEKVFGGTRSSPLALKRRHIFNDLMARVNSCPSLLIEKSDFLDRKSTRLNS